MSPDSSPPMPNEPRADRRIDLADVTVTAQVRAAWDVPLSEFVVRRPASGEVWRVEMSGHVAVVYVIDRSDDTLLVAAVGDDPAYADAATLLVDADSSPLGYPAGIWATITADLPDFAADRLIGELRDVRDDVVALYRWAEQDEDHSVAPERRGRRIGSNLDPVIDYRAALRDELRAVLDAAERLRVDEVEGPTPSLGDLLRDGGLRPTQLVELLGWDLSRARNAFSGPLYLTREEAETIAAELDIAVEDVETSVLPAPPDLVREIHQPEQRVNVDRLAQRRDVSEVTARRQALEEAAATKLRGVGRGDVDWKQVLDDYFTSVL